MDTQLEVDSVIKMYGETTILADVYLSCVPGDIIGLFGRNGTGKSTLLRIIFGSLKGDRSCIRINGKIQKKAAYRSGLLGFLPQEGYLPNNLSLSECVELLLGKEYRKDFFADKHLFRIRKSKVSEMSGGEKRYAEIKLILWGKAPFILLDEPFQGLSPIVSESIREHIKIASQSKGIILTDHNFREVHKCVNRIMLLNDCYLKELRDPNDLIPFGYFENE